MSTIDNRWANHAEVETSGAVGERQGWGYAARVAAVVKTLQAMRDRRDRTDELVAAGEVVDLRFPEG
ncbi:MAG: hypothetical protein AAF449_20915, partial [Myxococcota bacterium]